MNTNLHFTRRRFFQNALAATAACGLARIGGAEDVTAEPSATGPIVDTHVYLGHWPHARLEGDELAKLIANLRTNQVSQVWAGSFDGLFHKDAGAVNQRLADTCAQNGGGLLMPFGTVNPTLPDWEEDLRRCHQSLHMRGIRLHPNYHGYTLDDPRFARLVGLATVAGLVVQLVACMEDVPHKWLSPKAVQVDLQQLPKGIATIPNLRLIISNGFRSIDDRAFKTLIPLKQVNFDFARLDDANGLSQLVAQVSAKRIVFGSCAPLHPVEAMRSKFEGARLHEDQRKAIASETATRLINERSID